MVQEKTCKECSNQFIGFTPVCKPCTVAKRDAAGNGPNARVGLDIKSRTGFASSQEPASLSTGFHDEMQSSRGAQMPVMDSRRKTRPCKNYPNCRYADEDCHFMHPEELKTPFAHLRKICIQFKEEGKCKYGSRCHFSHCTDAEARDTSVDNHRTTSEVPSFGAMHRPSR
ncbi:zinc finger protein [Perkinsela sp. CCAP 1560/4]|nr:zinc finger protein [Perkinsela sp. CCAP 1560/4]|eukprot:KNH07015.1 zinc finger protein [Perkinsela sp. CCAP 1560/4]